MTKSGELSTLEDAHRKIAAMNDIKFYSALDTHKHGRQFHHHIAEIGLKVNLPYDQILAIIRHLFDTRMHYDKKIRSLSIREVYAFTLNNADTLKHDIRTSIALELAFNTEKPHGIIPVDFHFPQKLLFTFDGKEKNQKTMSKNVYKDYRYSAQLRSEPEKEFERCLEASPNVDWFYKNGDK